MINIQKITLVMIKGQINAGEISDRKGKQERSNLYPMRNFLELNINQGESLQVKKIDLLDKKKAKINGLIAGIRAKWQQIQKFLLLHYIQEETICYTQQSISSKLKTVEKLNRLMVILEKACRIHMQKVDSVEEPEESDNGFDRIVQDEGSQDKNSWLSYSNNTQGDRQKVSNYSRSYSKMCTPTFSESYTSQLSEMVNSKIRNQSEGNLSKLIEAQNLMPTFKNISVPENIKTNSDIKIMNEQTQTEQFLAETPQKQNRDEIEQLRQIKKNSKRIYKSILKIALKSMSICNNLLNRTGHNQQYEELKNSLNIMMSKFNEQYYLRDISCDIQFIQSMIKDTKKIYEKISSMCK